MMLPDSIYKKHIETFSVIGKQRRYIKIGNSLRKDIHHIYRHEKRQKLDDPAFPR